MCIGLMSDIKDQLIFWEIHHCMQCHRKLHRTKIGRQMPTMYTYFLNQKIPDLCCQCRIILSFYLLNIVFFCYLL